MHKKIFKEPQYWLIPFGVLFLCFIAYTTCHIPRDGDLYFMVANGDYIINNGFPKENPFVIHDGLKIVIQQWIPSVIAYFGYTKLGYAFVEIESVIGLFALVFVIYKLIDRSGPASFLAACIMVSTMMYLFVGKPMLYSMILLVTQMYVCENKKSWLWLPLIVLAEANIHASFIAFHFVYLLPYIVPGLTKMLNNRADYRYVKALPIMAIAALVNPYGLEGALYLFNSYGEDLKNVGISELNTISLSDIWGKIALVYLLFIFIQLYRKHIKPKIRIDSDRFYLFAGSLLLLILFPQSRNHIFLIIGSIPLISSLLPSGFKGKTPPTQFMWILALCGMLVTGIFIPKIPNMLPEMTPNGAEYLKGKECVLYNVFDEGSFYEMNGVKVFFDSRPELFFEKLNGKSNVIDDFKIMISKDEDKIAQTIEKYHFTHLSVYKKSTLFKYLKANDYTIVARDGDYYLFEAPENGA